MPGDAWGRKPYRMYFQGYLVEILLGGTFPRPQMLVQPSPSREDPGGDGRTPRNDKRVCVRARGERPGRCRDPQAPEREREREC